jgi:L-seryl-tRNA(Ser) seleniumtransferase
MSLAETFRRLPSVHDLTLLVERKLTGTSLPHALVVEVAREELSNTRARIAAGETLAAEALEQRVLARLAELSSPSLRPVLNASGVILQTNLGRAPLSTAALAAMQSVGAGYSNLEYDLEQGERGTRHLHLARLLCQLTGAEDALVVNNNAAALYLALIALAAGRQVIVSRGQAVEIGGGFRIPDVLRQSGAELVEVGTTNRTYARDYANAIGERTAMLLRVHTSNFRLMGFVHETPLAELAQLGHERGVVVLDDLGSGTLLDTAPFGLAPEPTVPSSVRAGADLVAFSGDKLLGGPQAGLLVGRADLIATLRKHPLARALRVDKTTIAGLAATLQSYLRGTALAELPVWRMIAATPTSLRERAEALAAGLQALGLELTPIACESTVGGGSLPGETLPSFGLGLELPSPDALAARLRLGSPALVARINAGRLLFDLRTLLPEQEDALVGALCDALGARG